MTDIFKNTQLYDDGQEFRQEELGNYYVDYIEAQSKNHLAIVFEGSQINTAQSAEQRYPWGGDFVYSQGVSVVGVKNKRPDWYRGEDLHLFFMSTAFQKLLKKYENIYLYGNSMGGYAALAFAGAVPGAKILCICPQSTLDPNLVPWDTRFPLAKGQDWEGHFADSSKTLGDVDVVYAVYDPFFPADRAHIKRLPQEKIVHLKTPFLLHDVAEKLLGMDLLKETFVHLIKGDLKTWFPKSIRVRKKYIEYKVVALFLWALRYYKRNEYEKAKLVLRHILKLDPNNETAEILLQSINDGREIAWTGFHEN